MTDPAATPVDTTVASPRRHLGWTAAVLLTLAPLLFALAREMWIAPFPINETVSVLEVAGVFSDTAGASHSLTDPTLVDFLDPRTRSWYRPLYWTTWYVFWHATHSLDQTVILFRILEVATPILLVLLFVWHLRPQGLGDYTAATAAIAVLLGTQAFRENLEIPLPITLVGMLAAMAVWWLLERPHRRWHDVALVLLTVLAIGYKEQGLVMVPVVVAAWWVGAPGIKRGTVTAVIVVTVLYLGMRFSTTGKWQPFEQDVSIGFETYAARDAATRFADTRHWVYAYSAAATVGNVLFAEPTDGRFTVVKAWQDDDLRPWQIINVASSAATTLLILWWAIRTWWFRGKTTIPAEWRMVVGLTIALVASAALGFNYARDRLGGMAVVFYALAAYSALRGITNRMDGNWLRPVIAALVLVLAVSWHLRAVGSVDWLAWHSRSVYRDWVANRHLERSERPPEAERWRQIFDGLQEQGLRYVPPRSSTYERWANRWMGTR